MKRGFKAECESLATAVRAEIGLDTRVPLNPRDLAAHLSIPIHPLSSLRGEAVAGAVRYATVENRAVLSAMTIFPDWPLPHRLIVYNDGNTRARQNSDISHELSHGLLMHEPRNAIANGCRSYDKAEEDQAAWLSGCLLVPRDAALTVAMSAASIHIAAMEYGVSVDLMRMRVNATGARTQANRAQARRSRP